MKGQVFNFKRPKKRRARPQDHEGCYVELTLRESAPNYPSGGKVLGYLYGFGAKFWGGLGTMVPTINLSQYPWPENRDHRIYTYEQRHVASMTCVQHSPVPWKQET